MNIQLYARLCGETNVELYFRRWARHVRTTTVDPPHCPSYLSTSCGRTSGYGQCSVLSLLSAWASSKSPPDIRNFQNTIYGILIVFFFSLKVRDEAVLNAGSSVVFLILLSPPSISTLLCLWLLSCHVMYIQLK